MTRDGWLKSDFKAFETSLHFGCGHRGCTGEFACAHQTETVKTLREQVRVLREALTKLRSLWYRRNRPLGEMQEGQRILDDALARTEASA